MDTAYSFIWEYSGFTLSRILSGSACPPNKNRGVSLLEQTDIGEQGRAVEQLYRTACVATD